MAKSEQDVREVLLAFRGDFLYKVPSKPHPIAIAKGSKYTDVATYVQQVHQLYSDEFGIGIPVNGNGEVKPVSLRSRIPSRVEVIVVTPTQTSSR